MRHLECCVCGEYAGKYQQHWNRDEGYGICQDCAKRESQRETPERMESLYGKAGVNYCAPGQPMQGYSDNESIAFFELFGV